MCESKSVFEEARKTFFNYAKSMQFDEKYPGTGSVAGFAGARALDSDALFATECGVLIPAAFENAGGMTVSCFEWVQSHQELYWEKDEIIGKLRDIMLKAYGAVRDLSRERDITLRHAAYQIAIDRRCAGGARPGGAARAQGAGQGASRPAGPAAVFSGERIPSGICSPAVVRPLLR